MRINYVFYIRRPLEEGNETIYSWQFAYYRIFEQRIKKYWFFRKHRWRKLKEEIIRRASEELRWFDHFSTPEKVLWLYENVTLPLKRGEKDTQYWTRRAHTFGDTVSYHFIRKLVEERKKGGCDQDEGEPKGAKSEHNE